MPGYSSLPQLAWLVLILIAPQVFAQTPNLSTVPAMDVLSDSEWDQVDAASAKALAWLATQQQPDGSFPTFLNGQPGVTALCTLSFLAHGHTPGEGPYGELLERAVSFIAKCQQANGLVAVMAPAGAKINRNVSRIVGGTATYNHGISSLTLCEVCSLTHSTTNQEIKAIVEKSIEATLAMQRWPKVRPVDRGGWRYLDLLTTTGEPVDSNLSNTVWQMLFLRSAKNAGFEVKQKTIDDAVVFIRNCFHPKYRTFVLMPSNHDHRTRGMSGAGVLCLALAGWHDSPEAQTAGD